MHKRVAISFFAMMLVFGLLIVQLALIAIKSETSVSSQTNNTKSIILSNSRGMIYDCNMKRMVNNYSKYITVALPTTEALNSLSSVVTDEENAQIFENMSNKKVSLISTSKIFDEPYLKTVEITDRYSSNQPCVHLIGHLDDEGKGATGLERAYDNFLSMNNGMLKVTWGVDALGHILYGDELKVQSESYLSPAGIQLTIDLELQKITESLLQEFEVNEGAIVVMDSSTAEILASASVPRFNPLDLSAGITQENSPFINRATSGYSVGSVFKPFVATTAIENGIVFSYNCTGNITINGTTFKCSNSTAHGFVNLTSATEKSCNTYFIALGQQLGEEKILSICNDFGLGKQIELADNFYLNSSHIPSTNSITSPQALANLCFGQGEMVISPIQMATAYCAFANGGYYRPPTLMKAIIDENGEAVQRVMLPEACRIISPSTAQALDEILESVVTSGNGNRAYSAITDCHGKTATAQSGWYRDGKEINHTWFCGYFTAGNKKITAVIFKENGVSGATDCAPIFKELAERVCGIIN